MSWPKSAENYARISTGRFHMAFQSAVFVQKSALFFALNLSSLGLCQSDLLFTHETEGGGGGGWGGSCLVHDVRDVVKMVMLTAVFSRLSVVYFYRPNHTGSVKKAAVSTFCIMLSFFAIGLVVPFPLVSFKGHRGCNEEQGISGFLLTFVSADCSLIAVS